MPPSKRPSARNTRALLINSPNNPTGVVYPAETLAAIGAMLERKQKELGRTIYVISDEPYARLAFDGNQVPPVFKYIRNSIVVTSHSKDLALPGERIGYLAANPAMDDCRPVPGRRHLLQPGPRLCQRPGHDAAPGGRPAARKRRCRRSTRQKRDMLYQPPDRSRLHHGQTGRRLLPLSRSHPLLTMSNSCGRAQQHNILLVPGSGFGAPGYFRIAYCVDMGIIERSLPAWERLAKDLGM